MKLPATLPHCARTFGLALLWLLFPLFQASAQTATAPAKPAKVISSYQELLEWLPKSFLPRKGMKWTQVQADAANELFAKKLKTESYTLDMRVVVSDVPTWNEKLQIYSEVTNREGYHIRFFGIFPDSKKPELAQVKIGNRVRVTGKLTSLKYHTLWNEFTLSIVTNPTELAR